MNPTISAHIQKQSESLFDKVKSYREHIHANPELSYREINTMNFISEKLTELGIPHQTKVGDTGIVGIIRNENHPLEMECIGLRADMDALPIQEENEISFKSTIDGIMHACGHDVHSAILLGTAEILNNIKDQLPQPVKLLFQPGEEKNPGGATYMIRDGALQNPKVKEMFALHVFPDMPVGKVGFKEGIYMASCDEIHITIHGKGGHGATPHQCIDPIVIGSEIILNVQTIVTRKCDPKIPCVLSFGHFEALGATNVIPSKAILKGTFRTMNEDWRAEALELIEKQAKGIIEANGGVAEIEISKGYPYLENNPETTQKLRTKAIAYLGADKVEELPIRLTAEDFSFYSQEIPVCFFRLGVRNESKGITYGVHHPKFNIDDEALKIGMQIMSLSVF